MVVTILRYGKHVRAGLKSNYRYRRIDQTTIGLKRGILRIDNS